MLRKSPACGHIRRRILRCHRPYFSKHRLRSHLVLLFAPILPIPVSTSTLRAITHAKTSPPPMPNLFPRARPRFLCGHQLQSIQSNFRINFLQRTPASPIAHLSTQATLLLSARTCSLDLFSHHLASPDLSLTQLLDRSIFPFPLPPFLLASSTDLHHSSQGSVDFCLVFPPLSVRSGTPSRPK